MQILRRSCIIGLAVLTAFLSFAPGAEALYSPWLAEQVTFIKQDIREARTKNGTGSLTNVMEDFQKENPEGKGYGSLFVHYSARVAQALGMTFFESGVNFLDSFSMVFGYWRGSGELISSCLRDDIWELQALQEVVLNEMLKSAVLSDYDLTERLWADYQLIQKFISGLKEFYKEPGIFFGGGNDNNLYLSGNCPYGEFDKAVGELGRSFDHFTETMTLQGEGSGSLNELINLAEKKAKLRAAAYIAQNKIGLTLGGGRNPNPTPLFGKPLSKAIADDGSQMLDKAMKGLGKGIDYLSQDSLLSTALNDMAKSGTEAVKDLADSVRQPISEAGDAYNRFQDLKQQEEALQKVYEFQEAEFVFGLQLQDVSEGNLETIDQLMFETNESIRSLTTASKESCGQMLDSLVKKQAVNRSSEFPDCK